MDQNIVFDAREAAAYLNVHYETVLRMSRRRELPHHRIGRKLLFRKDSLDRWIQNQEHGSVVPSAADEKVTFLYKVMEQ